MIKIAKLKFKGSIHIGEAGLGLEETSPIIHSDTLYSAIFQAWLRLFNEPMADVLLTSAFPFVDSDYYFPRPLLPIPDFTAELATQYGKAIKRLRFVDRDHFCKWISGKALDMETMLAKGATVAKTMHTVVRPKVALDRMTSSSNLYFVGEAVFAKRHEAGLFFLVDLNAEQWPKFQSALKFLGEEGIGGRRSQGYGAFEADFSESFVPMEPENPNAFVTLSLFYPACEDEVKDSLIAYRLVERTGWLEGGKGNLGMRHKRILMMTEGSVFRKRVAGTLVDVAPESFKSHPVYRNGLAFTIGAKSEVAGHG